MFSSKKSGLLALLCLCFTVVFIVSSYAVEPVNHWQPLSGEWQEDEDIRISTGTSGSMVLKDVYADFLIHVEFLAHRDDNGRIWFHSLDLPVLPVPENMNIKEIPLTRYGYFVSFSSESGLTGSLGIRDQEGERILSSPSLESMDTFRKKEWNQVRIQSIGSEITVWLNDVLAYTVQDETFIYGQIVIQAPDVPLADTDKEPMFRVGETKNLGRSGSWRSVFNGEDLTGWEIWGTEEFTVEQDNSDAVIAGRSGPDKSEGYLCTEEHFRDFRVRGMFRMLGAGNYGLFYHSTIHLREDGYPIISGVQGEVEPSYPGNTGLLYESYRRGWLTPPDQNRLGAWALRHGPQWNEIEIRSRGNRVTSWVNGVRVIDFTDPEQQLFEGGFALQLHAGGTEGILWKDIYVLE